MQPYDSRIRKAARNGIRIKPIRIRNLYYTLCDHLIRFSPIVEVEVAPFETRFTGTGEISIRISPYSDLFMVSVGETATCDIRVVDEESYFRALDLSLSHLLSATANAIEG